ncbi:HipA N-terminal domain-containing protein [Chryseobacterium jejuense]|uniref:HipA N-terminal domain-containing protein n=1 Tax=Chryseobacterium jejuense TaxID=445960 RepID=UPI001AE98AC7|nr:HipA N-terminal domain-containing protein [Chryseobacterium jejuense]MBP2614908.1 HipA-like protein [Chryseobacterium jejuense]
MLGLGRILAILRKEGSSVSVDEIIDASNSYELQPIVKSFNLFLKDLKVGVLSYSKESSIWHFEYSEEFKNNSNDYNLIIGFPDINKKYESDKLWPFFNIRIPGLKQPKVKEILIKENISPDDNVQLLERFGKRSISNPFELQVNI